MAQVEVNPAQEREHQQRGAQQSEASKGGEAGAKKDEKTPLTPAQRGRRIAILAIVLVAAAIAGYFLWVHFSAYESTDDAQVDGHINSISSRVNGMVVAVNVEDNQKVEAGTVLAQIDPRDYQVAVEQAKANLADAQAQANALRNDVPVTSQQTASSVSGAAAGTREAQAGVAVAERTVNAVQARIGSAAARVSEAQANYDKAAKDLARYKVLVDKDEISRQQYDAAVAAAEAMKATLESTRAAYVEAQQNSSVAQSQVTQAQARVAQLQAQEQATRVGPRQVAASQARYEAALATVEQRRAALDQAQLNLQYTTVRSPVAGVIGKKSVEVGQNVSIGQEMLAVVPLHDVWITANFKETQLKNIRVGQRVGIHVDAYGRDYKGHVESVAAASGARFSLLPPENATGNYVKVVQRLPVRIRLEAGENDDQSLRPGMSVTPKVYIK